MSRLLAIVILPLLTSCGGGKNSEADQIRDMTGSMALECVSLRASSMGNPNVRDARKAVASCDAELELYSRRNAEAMFDRPLDLEDAEMAEVYNEHRRIVADHLVDEIISGASIRYD